MSFTPAQNVKGMQDAILHDPKAILNPTKGVGREFAQQMTFGGFGAQYVKGQNDAEAAKNAAKLAKENSEKQLALADQAFNKANMKKPDLAGYLYGNKMENAGATDLGGAKDKPLLGKTTLLGA